MILKVREVGDPILRSKAKKVININQKTSDLINNMIETMYSEDGVGLAAPQIGVLKRIIVADTGEELIEIINPEIIEKDGEKIAEEGCLSIPDQKGKVKRAAKIKVKGKTKKGDILNREAEGLLARIIQHEIDHLNGVLFIDKIEDFR